jgi:hypothetical protein
MGLFKFMTPEQTSLAEAVAAQLSLPPAPGFDAHWARVFTLPDGGRLYISAGRQRGHLHVSASVADGLRDHRPYYPAGEAPKSSINVADTKTAAQIAADIRRRLLPEHEREAVDHATRKTRRDDYNARQTQALTKFAIPLGERVQCDERSGEPRPLVIDRPDKFSLKAKPFCDFVNLEIVTSPDIAGQIAALLAAL